MNIRILAGLVLLGLIAHAHAGPDEAIRAKLKQAMPEAEVTSIKPSPIMGLYQVTSRNYEPVLATADGRYLVQGEILEVRGDKIISVSDQVLATERRQRLAAMKPEDMIIFPAEGKPKRTLYVFTDVDCGYCRKLHQEVPVLNKAGVEVRYLAFPRSGPDTPASAKMDAVWCAKDRLGALTQAKRGIPVATSASALNCKSLVDTEYQMGVDLGVTGTPSVFTTDGQQVGGYVPAAKLLKLLGVQ